MSESAPSAPTWTSSSATGRRPSPSSAPPCASPARASAATSRSSSSSGWCSRPAARRAAAGLGPSAVERLFDHRQQELAEVYAGRTHGRALPELARALAAIQDENGYMAECRQTGEDRWLVSEHNCAIARVAGTWPTACNHELALFRQLAGPGVAVERVAHIQSGDPVCAYVLRAANGDGAGPGAPQAEATDQAIPGEP